MKQIGFTLLAFAFLMVATIYSQLNSITAASTIPVSKTSIKSDNLATKMFMAPWVELCEEEEQEEDEDSTRHDELAYFHKNFEYISTFTENHNRYDSIFQPLRLTYPHLQSFSPPPDMRG
ncbi:hypothetical protein [Aquirufa rosea]|uniref:Uncharacterized protein n=1 Tax=Aquirufa rosea TaxID=2509241 RepID=A0A4Q1BYK4_9BACT|nr:hypothetical protein [Aquirufa rosea]RXK48163.1 hypothetical protein ESB04_08940 [Aquirufa rosea]